MRSFILVVIACAASAAEVESFTLADGRVLVGTYDDQRGRLKLDGELAVELTVAPDEIVARAPHEIAEPAEPSPEPDPLADAERDRTRIESTLRMVERRRGEIEKYRGWATARRVATETGLTAATADEERAATAVAEHDQAIAAIDAQSEALKDQRALFDARVVEARARFDREGEVKEVEIAELRRELTAMDARLAELAGRIAHGQQLRRSAQAAQARAAARRRELERDRDEFSGRERRAERDLEANAASLERLRSRLAEVDGRDPVAAPTE